MIIDYSVARPSVRALKAAGVTAVGRYIGWDSEPGFPSMGKNITASEAHELISAGISVWLAFEYAADAVKGGAAQGRKDGELAIRQLAALGAPPGITVYFAMDFDIGDYAPKLSGTPENSAAKLGPAADYFRAVNMLHPPYQVGVYGGYWACSRVLDAGLASMAWQTVAWSGGRRDPRAVLYQLAGKAPIAGADVNLHESTHPDFGQWPRPGQGGTDWTEAMMAQLPILQQGARDAAGQARLVHRVQLLTAGIGAWNNLGSVTQIPADGTFGPSTTAAVKAVQKYFGLAADGICGPKTWGKLVTGQ